MLSESFATAGEQVDVTPFIQLTGGYVTQMQRNRNIFSHAIAVYPLYLLIDISQPEVVKSQLDLNSRLQLIDADQLKAFYLKSNVSLRFHIDDFSQIYGEEMILMEGARYAYKTRINSPTMVLRELPVGVYSLLLPTGKNHKYQPTEGYLVVKQGNNAAEIHFVKKAVSPIISQKINLLGIADRVFSSVLVDYALGKLVIDVITPTPHEYFPGETYARITVRDPQGKIIFSKDIHGTDASVSYDELTLSMAEQIEIYHEEPERIRVNPTYPDIIDNNNKTNVLTITDKGLKNVALKGDPEQALLARLESAVVSLRSFTQAYYATFSSYKDDIYLAINAFDSPLREQLLVRYKDCIPANNIPPDDNKGNAFTIAYRGIGDHLFLTGTLNLIKKTLTVKIEAGIAHNYFPEVYASFTYEDADGNRLYHDEVIGNQRQKERSVELSLSGYGGEVIRLYHQEPDERLIITNDMKKVKLDEKGKRQNYRITAVGLERIAD